MKKGAKTTNTFIAVSIMFIAVFGFIYMQLDTSGKQEQSFNPSKITEASQLYDGIMEFNYIADYPETPEEIMDAFLKTVRILYGDMLRSDEYIYNVIEKQREFFSEDILRLTRIDDQFNNFKEQVEILSKSGMVCISMEQKVPIFSDESDACTIRVTQYNSSASGAQNRYYVYYLNRENTEKRWKVANWQTTDSSFNPS